MKQRCLLGGAATAYPCAILWSPCANAGLQSTQDQIERPAIFCHPEVHIHGSCRPSCCPKHQIVWMPICLASLPVSCRARKMFRVWDYEQHELNITVLEIDQYSYANISSSNLYVFQRGPAILVIHNLKADLVPDQGIMLIITGINMTELGKEGLQCVARVQMFVGCSFVLTRAVNIAATQHTRKGFWNSKADIHALHSHEVGSSLPWQHHLQCICTHGSHDLVEWCNPNVWAAHHGSCRCACWLYSLLCALQ